MNRTSTPGGSAEPSFCAFLKNPWITILLGLVVLIAANYVQRRYVEGADRLIGNRYLINMYPRLQEYYSSPARWWRLLLPIPEAEYLWKPSSFLLTDVVQAVLPTPASAWYLFHAILILVAFFTSYFVFRSQVFSFTLAICAGFGTQVYSAYTESIHIGFLLVLSYYLLLLFTAYKLIRGAAHPVACALFFLVFLLASVLGYEGWLDCFAFWVLGSAYLAVTLWRMGDKRRVVRVGLLLLPVTAVTILYSIVKCQAGVWRGGVGQESDVVLHYPFLSVAIEDVISKYLTYLYIVLTNFLPPCVLGSNSLYLHGPQTLIDLQAGYHAHESYLIPMQHVFLWRYYAGMAFVLFAWCLYKAIARSQKTLNPAYVAISLFLLMVAVTSPAHVLVKARPYLSVPMYAFPVLFSVLGMALSISWLLMTAARRLTRRRWATAVVLSGWLLIFYGGVSRPAYLDHLCAIVDIQSKYPDPMDTILRRLFTSARQPKRDGLQEWGKAAETYRDEVSRLPARASAPRHSTEP